MKHSGHLVSSSCRQRGIAVRDFEKEALGAPRSVVQSYDHTLLLLLITID